MLTENQIKLTIGSLLHDIGKVTYRGGDGRAHSQSGYEFLKNEADVGDQIILDCVRFHHGRDIGSAKLPDNALAYITYYADNVAAFADRRDAEEGEEGFDRSIPLASVFNVLNGNHGKCHYAHQTLEPDGKINYPTEETAELDASFYKKIIERITSNLKGIVWEEEYISSLLSVLEANLSYIPSSTSKRELADISLFDHLKMTAAIAACVEQFLGTEKEENYKERLMVNAKQSYEEKMFLLYSMDISGIQKFIYTVGEKGALKGLRARSFYLEIMMEHMVDELLERVSLTRANLIYTGGGHCYLLLPNTQEVKEKLQTYHREMNSWFLNYFDTALFIAYGYAEASANNFRDVPSGSYSELYQVISKMISSQKFHRYGASEIQMLNCKERRGERECVTCRQMAVLDERDHCSVCRALEKLFSNVLHKKYFTILNKSEPDALPLPGNQYLVADSEKELRTCMETPVYKRCYTKNSIYTGKHVTTKLWVGDYSAKETFEELAKQSKGIKRIGILRADVDNLGKTFVHGFERLGDHNHYTTLSRTATLSRQLSLFFKFYINQILQDNERNVTIIYSGGDDIFLAGAWNEVIEAFIDLQSALKRFTQGTLTISGGIGVYHSKYPINVMAKEVEHLEDASKGVEGKNAITIFSDLHSYPWLEFTEKVMKEKMNLLRSFFTDDNERGMNFLYNLTELLRDQTEKIQIARYVYLLSKMEPLETEGKEKMEAYRVFSRKMYEWVQEETDRRELITAIYIFVYMHREEKEDVTDDIDE